jgi:acyl-CoA thioesterase FadM
MRPDSAKHCRFPRQASPADVPSHVRRETSEDSCVSGLLRNIIALLVGMFAHAGKAAGDVTVTGFWVTPFDGGLRVLKSDKYFQFAETAQVDYLMKIGMLFALVRSGTSFVNVAQLVKFSRPVSIFSRVRVETRLIYADGKCAYFSHVVHAAGTRAAEVLVKMKFKKGGRTVPPSRFLSASFATMPPEVQIWESVLEVL